MKNLQENDCVYSFQEAGKVLEENPDWFAAAYGLEYFQFHKTNINLIDDEPHLNIMPSWKDGCWKIFWKEPGIGWFQVTKRIEVTEKELIKNLESLDFESIRRETENE